MAIIVFGNFNIMDISCLSLVNVFALFYILFANMTSSDFKYKMYTAHNRNVLDSVYERAGHCGTSL
jgi:hypothetical protein